MSKRKVFLCGAILLLGRLSVALAADDLKMQLGKSGVRVIGDRAVLVAELDLARELRDVSNLRRDLVSAEKRYEEYRKAVNTLEKQIYQMDLQSSQLNAQLALTNVADVAANNRLVGAINATTAQIRLAYLRREKLDELEGEVHGGLSRARDALISYVLDLRKHADSVAKMYASPDRETVQLIDQYNLKNKTSVKLEPTSGFTAKLRKIEHVEAEVRVDKVPLRREGKTYWVSASINGNDVIEMVVDSGASLVTIPYADAVTLGLKPGKGDPKIKLVVADGRAITGTLMTIDAMRVGVFEARDVKCAVLEPSAVNAAPLLGMSFLGEFKFEIDSGESTLAMTQVSTGESSSRRIDPEVKSSPKQTLTLDHDEWRLQPVKSGMRFLSDRVYVLKTLPDELDGSFVLVRPQKEIRQWINGEVVGTQPGTIYVAVMTHVLQPGKKTPQEDVSDEVIEAFLADGWEKIEGFETTTWSTAKWDWIVLARKSEAGKISVPASRPVNASLVFFFK